MSMMNKSEREDLLRLIRQREKVLKSAARQRSAELLADFETQMGSEFAFDDDAVWAQAYNEAAIEIKKHRRLSRSDAANSASRIALRPISKWSGDIAVTII